MINSFFIFIQRFGRLTTIIGCSLLGGVFGILQSISSSFEIYILLEFLVALANSGIIGTTFIYNAEWVTSKHRVILNSINGFGNALGCTGVGLAAMYYQNNFTAFKLAMSIPSFIIILYYFVLQESPRWLLAQQKHKKAIKSMSKAARFNGRSLSEKTISIIERQSIRAINSVTAQSNYELSFCDVVRNTTLLWRLIVLSLVWIFALFSYYGIILSSTEIHENKYLSFIIVALAEIPGIFLAILTLDRFGRRTTVGSTLFIGGLSILLSALLTKSQWLYKMILFNIGKAAMTTTFLSLYTYSAELWPTTLRNITMNICLMVGRSGGMFASYTILLHENYPYLPPLFCGIVSILAGILIFSFLPETSKCRKLPDTIDEAIAIGSNENRQQTELK